MKRIIYYVWAILVLFSVVIFYAAIIFYIAWKIIGKKKPS